MGVGSCAYTASMRAYGIVFSILTAGCLPEIRTLNDGSSDASVSDVDQVGLDAEVRDAGSGPEVLTSDRFESFDAEDHLDAQDESRSSFDSSGHDHIDANPLESGSPLLSPLLVTPYAGAMATGRRPTLRWSNRGGDGAQVELCSDRQCTSIIETIRASGNQTEVTRDLPTGVSFWRVRPIRGEQLGEDTSETSQFTVLPSQAQRSCLFGMHLDLNGDGYDDIIQPVSDGIDWFAGSRSGLAVRPHRIPTPGFSPSRSTGAGDFDGDGITDLALIDSGRREIGLVRGGATPRWDDSSGAGPFPDNQSGGVRLVSAGDLDGDGVADLVYFESNGVEVRLLFGVRPTVRGARVRFIDNVLNHGRTFGMVGGPGTLTNVNCDRFSDVIFNFGPEALMIQGAPRDRLQAHFFSSVGGHLLSLGDQNGDGSPDILAFTGGVFQQAAVYRTLSSLLTNTPDEMVSHPMNCTAGTPGDINADGYADFVYAPRAGGWQAMLGGPAGFRPLPASIGGNETEGRFTVFATGFVDTNGDGVMEILARLISNTTSTVIWRWGESSAQWTGPAEAGFE